MVIFLADTGDHGKKTRRAQTRRHMEVHHTLTESDHWHILAPTIGIVYGMFDYQQKGSSSIAYIATRPGYHLLSPRNLGPGWPQCFHVQTVLKR